MWVLIPPAGEEGKKKESLLTTDSMSLLKMGGNVPSAINHQIRSLRRHTPVTIETGTLWTTPLFIKKDGACGRSPPPAMGVEMDEGGKAFVRGPLWFLVQPALHPLGGPQKKVLWRLLY